MYCIGPSHIHAEYLARVQDEIVSGEMFAGVELDGHRGMPVWSSYIRRHIAENVAKGLDVVWMVIDFKANNKDFARLYELRDGPELYLDVMGHPNNVDRELMGTEHMKVLGQHSLRVIDKAVADFPEIKLIFWCMFMRSKCNQSSYPDYLHYDALRGRYAANIIDIEAFITPAQFRELVTDDGGHPNAAGFALLDKMLKCPSLNRAAEKVR